MWHTNKYDSSRQKNLLAIRVLHGKIAPKICSRFVREPRARPAASPEEFRMERLQARLHSTRLVASEDARNLPY
jgi:hypothetical protein